MPCHDGSLCKALAGGDSVPTGDNRHSVDLYRVRLKWVKFVVAATRLEQGAANGENGSQAALADGPLTARRCRPAERRKQNLEAEILVRAAETSSSPLESARGAVSPSLR